MGTEGDLGKLLPHAAESLHVPSALLLNGAGIVIDVLLGVDAPQVAAHGEGLAKRVCDDAVSSHIDDLLRQLWVRAFQQQRQHRCHPIPLHPLQTAAASP